MPTRNKKLPPSWAVAKLILLPKEDWDLTKPQLYRSISLLNADYKNFTMILAMRLNGILGNYVHQVQVGFIKKSSTEG